MLEGSRLEGIGREQGADGRMQNARVHERPCVQRPAGHGVCCVVLGCERSRVLVLRARSAVRGARLLVRATKLGRVLPLPRGAIHG